MWQPGTQPRSASMPPAGGMPRSRLSIGNTIAGIPDMSGGASPAAPMRPPGLAGSGGAKAGDNNQTHSQGIPQPGMPGTFAFDEGGAFEGDGGIGDADPMSSALDVVKQVMQYGQQKFAGKMPSNPGRDEPPAPGPLPPTSNPFGKRNNPMPAGGGRVASAIPSNPGRETPPAPGPLPPTSNPFGKRNTPFPAGAQNQDDQGIPDDEEVA